MRDESFQQGYDAGFKAGFELASKQAKPLKYKTHSCAECGRWGVFQCVEYCSACWHRCNKDCLHTWPPEEEEES